MSTQCNRTIPECAPSTFESRNIWTTPAPYTSLDCRGMNVTNPLWYQFVAGPGDIDIFLEKGECNPGGYFGVGIMVTIWESCPGFSANCIIASGCPQNNGQPNPFIDFTIPEGLLTVGQIYALTVSSCDGAECDFTMEIDAEDLDVPMLNDPSVSMDVGSGCESNTLPPFTYCENASFRVEIDNEIYEQVVGQWYWVVNELDADADASTIVWSADIHSGIGSPMINGMFDPPRFYMGSNGIDLDFNSTGKYEICLNFLTTNCGEVEGGPLCQEITIIPPPPTQFFDDIEICYSTLLDGSWAGPEFPNDLGESWVAGSISLGDIQSSPQDDDDYYVVTKISPPDRCGCIYEQQIRIKIVAENEPGEAELSLIECQLPYTWFDITIYTLDEYYQVPIRLFQASEE
ncbi:MAG: hypothetical protein KJO29_03260, partial [Bacteroidia bacterium]|nr:hypothetical protein [Bacteroidia bacterium]